MKSQHGKIHAELFTLLERMQAIQSQFNAELVPCGPDVARLALVDNGIGWEAICETAAPDGTPRFDLWYRGRLKLPDLDLETAAHKMVGFYIDGKYKRVLRRLKTSHAAIS